MNNYPVLAPNSTWFAPNDTTITRSIITEIEIMDSYMPDSSVTVVDSWDASEAQDGSITCYVIGTKLIMAGNGSGKIAANEDSSYLFCDSGYKDFFSNAVSVEGLHSIDVSGATSLEYCFEHLQKVTEIHVEEWDVSNCTNLSSMFMFCSKLTTIDLKAWDVGKCLNFAQMFAICSNLSSVDLSRWDTSSAMNLVRMFLYCSSLVTIGDVSNWNVSNVLFINGVFAECQKLEGLNASKWVLSSLQNATQAFENCISVKNVDVSNWNMMNCTDISFMFYKCTSLGEIDVSNWDVSNVTNFDHFAAHANLKRKGIENWNVSSATNMNALFHNCAEEELDLSGWDVSKVQFFCQMFENSPNLKRVKGLENWNTSAGLGFDGMFERCYVLEELDLSSFDTSKAKNGVTGSGNGHKTATLNNMFYSCNNLKKVTVGPNFSINGDGTNTVAENMAILPTPSTDYIEGADGMWYTFNGDAYAPDAIKDRTYNIYYASKNLIHDLSVRVNNGTILDIVKAIREKVPNLEPTLLSDLDDVISSKVFEPVLEVDEEGNAIITATALSIDEEGNATIIA